jgi:hypothetical protein
MPRAACCGPCLLAQARRGDAACALLFGARLRELASALLQPEQGEGDSGGGDERRACGAAGAACEALPPLTLFNEQFIVKPPHSGAHAAFAWHRDAAWCRTQARSAPHARFPPKPRRRLTTRATFADE